MPFSLQVLAGNRAGDQSRLPLVADNVLRLARG